MGPGSPSRANHPPTPYHLLPIPYYLFPNPYSLIPTPYRRQAFKIAAFVLSGAFAGLAGGLFAHLFQLVAPEQAHPAVGVHDAKIAGIAEPIAKRPGGGLLVLEIGLDIELAQPDSHQPLDSRRALAAMLVDDLDAGDDPRGLTVPRAAGHKTPRKNITASRIVYIAKTKQQALAYVARRTFDSELAAQETLVTLLSRGVQVEDATNEPSAD